MGKKRSYEENLLEIDDIIEKLENGELSLEASIKEYEKSKKLIEECNKILNEAQGKVEKVVIENNKINLKNLD